MTVLNFQEITQNIDFFLNKAIEIVDIDSFAEVNFDKKMRCLLVDYKIHEKGTEEEYYDLILDFKAFESYNIAHMPKDFYDENSELTKRWIDTKDYERKNGRDYLSIYSDINISEEDNKFKLVDDKKQQLYQLFKESNHVSYFDFLEEIAL